MSQDLMEKIVSLCKRRGFIYPGSEIYGGLANTWDYGPLGTELKNNIKRAWWKYFVQDREDMVGIDGGVILKADVWEASGHVKNFKDPLVECKKCHKRFRPDKLKGGKCPECEGELTEEKYFSGMFKTTIGPVEKEGTMVYLRPETAQNIFINFKNVLNSTTVKVPFGIGQMGKCFRNEITTGNFIFRTIEFEIMELEYFISPKDNWEKVFKQWLDYIHKFTEKIGLDNKKLHDVEIPKEDLAHYSKRTVDMYYEFPFGKDELWGIAYRTDHDLSNHQRASGQSMEYFDEKTDKKYIPHVIEPTFGIDRTILSVLAEAYYEEEVKGEKRVVLKFKPDMAPYKVAVFPLLKNKPKLVKKACDVYNNLNKEFNSAYDDNSSIGKRYRRQDEAGTPYTITIDFDSLKNDDVTLRDRDTMKQERVKINELVDYLREKLEGR